MVTCVSIWFADKEDLIYAFPTDSLFTVDLANLANPTVIKHILVSP